MGAIYRLPCYPNFLYKMHIFCLCEEPDSRMVLCVVMVAKAAGAAMGSSGRRCSSGSMSSSVYYAIGCQN